MRPSNSDAGLGPSEFDAFVDGLDYPMFVVTVAHDGRRAGCLVGFTTQASCDPARMLVCLSEQNHTYAVARTASLLAYTCSTRTSRGLPEAHRRPGRRPAPARRPRRLPARAGRRRVRQEGSGLSHEEGKDLSHGQPA